MVSTPIKVSGSIPTGVDVALTLRLWHACARGGISHRRLFHADQQSHSEPWPAELAEATAASLDPIEAGGFLLPRRRAGARSPALSIQSTAVNSPLLQRWRRARRTTVVAVLDRDGWSTCTDNIVVVDADRRRLTWVPRDLWSWRCAARINAAFARGGHPLLQAALAELGLPVASSLVLRRCAVERALATLRITVPVPRTRRYWYPLAPRLRLEDGARLVTFTAPQETLEGERLHQWLGARRSADLPAPPLPDLDRIQRQQVLVRRLLEERFAFAAALEDPGASALSDPQALALLAQVRADWRMDTLDRVVPFLCDGQQALRLRSRLGHALGGLSHGLRALRPRSEA